MGAAGAKAAEALDTVLGIPEKEDGWVGGGGGIDAIGVSEVGDIGCAGGNALLSLDVEREDGAINCVRRAGVSCPV